jgi:glycosyltransferase involved in cell wall biosynthesis
MRIAQIAPLHESVPPRLYGGTERIVSWLTEELVRRGHEVTLFASGDSVTRGRLVSCAPRALRLDPECVDPLAHHVVQLERLARRAEDFDVIHNHADYLPFTLLRRLGVPHVSTLHGRLDIPDLRPLYDEYREVPLISISDAQRRPLPGLAWRATIHHGLPPRLHSLRAAPGEYLAFLGRISPEKGVVQTIEIARLAGLPLRIAAKVAAADREYHEREVQPLLGGDVELVGEIADEDKDDFLGRAAALLFPIAWEEPFGLVLIEAMACGTPVVAFRRGSVPEVIEPGVSGFIVETVEEAVAAVEQARALSRPAVRAAFEARFTAGRMAADYERVLERVARSGLHEAAP